MAQDQNSNETSLIPERPFESTSSADPAVYLGNSSSLPTAPVPTGSASFSLITMFQILTACCIFFAVLRASPLLAIIGTVITTPAIIRTAMAAELHRQAGMRFRWITRLRCFFESTGLTVVTLALSATVFALVSLTFGLICLAASFVLGTPELATDIALVGTVGGMVWGAAGGMLAFGYCVRHWQPVISKPPTIERS